MSLFACASASKAHGAVGEGSAATTDQTRPRLHPSMELKSETGTGPATHTADAVGAGELPATQAGRRRPAES